MLRRCGGNIGDIGFLGVPGILRMHGTNHNCGINDAKWPSWWLYVTMISIWVVKGSVGRTWFNMLMLIFFKQKVYVWTFHVWLPVIEPCQSYSNVTPKCQNRCGRCPKIALIQRLCVPFFLNDLMLPPGPFFKGAGCNKIVRFRKWYIPKILIFVWFTLFVGWFTLFFGWFTLQENLFITTTKTPRFHAGCACGSGRRCCVAIPWSVQCRWVVFFGSKKNRSKLEESGDPWLPSLKLT